ncbi:LOW QUALITY PROTEIN: monocarboxylate transporter 2 [Myxocyprinus asiaticus]|uniref:LOW QUALITY PROTEIN: monocarboxylate transporter 2 n=1 Tax=Myxocyprinus asiaticus TaxID=70543 RepID=UPI002221F8BE|nr:LOW QUALITY PROTEIN: monocarboxylate transporter 2 [Myxocyprinus asiaticus]
MPPSANTNLGYTPLDGGWGWAVVFGSFISISFSTYTFLKSLTIYFKEIQESVSVYLSVCLSIKPVCLSCLFVFPLIFPTCSILVNRYGCRPVVKAGGLMVGASFGTTILHFYICVGVIGGFGLVFNLQPALKIIGKYFLVKRPVANGLAMAGSPVFLSTLAPLNQFLFDKFRWRGSFLILGSLLLSCCMAGSLMRPINRGVKEAVKSQLTSKQSGCAAKVNQFNDISLFKHRGFLIYLVGNVVMFFGFFSPVVFLAPYAKHRGIDEHSAVFLLSIFALVDMFSYPGTGLIANTRWIRYKIQYFFSFAVAYNGILHLMCPLLPGYIRLVMYAVFFGMAFGMVCAFLFEVLMDLVGTQQLSSAVGLVTIIECGPVLLRSPISVKLVDIFNDHTYMYFACGVMMLVAGVFLFIMNYYNCRWLEQEDKHRKVEELQIGAAKDLAAMEVAKDKRVELKLNLEDKATHSTYK